LTGVRVVDLGRYIAGPLCSSLLGDLGADVIRIERVGGGEDRAVLELAEGADSGAGYLAQNRNKRGVTLNPSSPEGRKVLKRLIATADVVVVNLPLFAIKQLGLDYETLKAANPAIVCLHISAYGRDNERKAWPGYDFLMQAEAGLMTLTGEPDGPPQRFGSSMIDFMTGMTGVIGLLSCIMRARQTGKGCDVDTCLFDVAMHQLSYPGTWYMNGGAMPSRLARSAHQSLTPVQTVRTKDGWIYVMCMKDKFWEELARRIGRPAHLEDPRFATAAARRENRAALTEVLDEAMGLKTTEEWLGLLRGHLPVAPIYDVAQAVANPFVAAAGCVQQVPHPANPDFKMLANPLKIDGRRLDLKPCSPLGADTVALVGVDQAAE
jgi:crotonobetainyl-CoA:carnitine CoA-transferase CaiB-like acyl-CoA transferase